MVVAAGGKCSSKGWKKYRMGVRGGSESRRRLKQMLEPWLSEGKRGPCRGKSRCTGPGGCPAGSVLGAVRRSVWLERSERGRESQG